MFKIFIYWALILFKGKGSHGLHSTFYLLVLCMCILNIQEVLTQLTSRLASHLNDLTIQVVKEDWSLPSGPSTTSSHINPLPNPTGVGITRYPYGLTPMPEVTTGANTVPMPSELSTGYNPVTPPQVGHYSFNPTLKQDLHVSHQ